MLVGFFFGRRNEICIEVLWKDNRSHLLQVCGTEKGQWLALRGSGAGGSY